MKKERSKPLRKNLLSKLFMTAGAVASIGLGIVTYDYFTNPVRTLERIKYSGEIRPDSKELAEARTNTLVRQTYLDNLLTNSPLPAGVQVVYDCDGTKITDFYHQLMLYENKAARKRTIELRKRSIDEMNFGIKTIGKTKASEWGLMPRIFVGPDFFDSNKNQLNDDDIRHIIFYHEGRHAEQFIKGPGALGYFSTYVVSLEVKYKNINPLTEKVIMEADAMNSELKAIREGKSRVTPQLFNGLVERQKEVYNELTSALKCSTPVQKEYIESAFEVLTKN